MKGKLGLIVGLTAGYVLGTRAGRERFEQISQAASKVWQTSPVQKQVVKAKKFAKTSALALPGAIWDTAIKVVKASSNAKTLGDKLDSAIAETKKAVPAVTAAAETSAEAVTDAVEDVVEKVADAKKPAPNNTTSPTKKS